MPTVREIEQALFRLAPKEGAMDWDNVGQLLGDPEAEVRLVALDITEAVADEAIAENCQLIVSHHPVMNCKWLPVQTVRQDTPQGHLLLKILRSGLSAICMHTNLDVAPGGVNDALAAALGLEDPGPLGDPEGLCRMGTLASPMPLQEFAKHVCRALQANGVRYAGDSGPVRKVAVGGGACGSMLPQVRAMYNGDHARKDSLVKYGFRLPCAYDNRPLKFEEFEERIGQAVFVSATPGPYERERADQVVEQVIRPTGLLDPRVEVRPVTGQIDDLMDEIRARAARDERVLVTTLTKKMAEDLTEYLKNAGIRVRYMHSDVQTIERMEIIRSLRLGEFDVLVGINLLREGLDLPEVSLVAILDADKEGFLRSETSLIQTIGRAARNADGLVIMYADEITPSMRAAIDETERRRKIQDDYNRAHGIVPKTIIKDVREILEISKTEEESRKPKGKAKKLTDAERAAEIAKLEQEMKEASKLLEFEYAAVLRDRIIELRGGK